MRLAYLSSFALFLLLLLEPACGGSVPGTIGAALGQTSDHRLYVRSLPPGQGAERAGLLLDDEILAIDGKDVRSMTQDDVRRAVRGDVGTTMVLTVRHADPDLATDAGPDPGAAQKRDVKVVRTPLLAESKGK